MNVSDGNTAATGLRGWWLSPARPGMQRLIAPWEYRHLRVFGTTRIFGGSVAAAAGVVCLSYGVHGWATFFLVLGALNLAGGYWYLTIDRSASASTKAQGTHLGSPTSRWQLGRVRPAGNPDQA